MTREADIAGNLYDAGAELEQRNRTLRAMLDHAQRAEDDLRAALDRIENENVTLRRGLHALERTRTVLLRVARVIDENALDIEDPLLADINDAIGVAYVALRAAGRLP